MNHNGRVAVATCHTFHTGSDRLPPTAIDRCTTPRFSSPTWRPVLVSTRSSTTATPFTRLSQLCHRRAADVFSKANGAKTLRSLRHPGRLGGEAYFYTAQDARRAIKATTATTGEPSPWRSPRAAVPGRCRSTGSRAPPRTGTPSRC